MGYYHETPSDPFFDRTLYEVLEDLCANGTVVVCAAGNDATSRPNFPAAFAPWSDGAGPVTPLPGVLPIVSVGALNPSRRSDALSSIRAAGPWVRAHEIGAGLVSTFPTTFDGGNQSDVATEFGGRDRASLDIDDFTGGFGTWSGTSFAALLLAGRIAQRLFESGPATNADEATTRAWAVLEELTTLRSDS